MSLKLKSDNNKFMKALYLVSTPIGNLNDISLRAIDVLKQSDYILCEDTRISKILLKKFDINTNLISNHKFNEVKNLDKIIRLLNSNFLVSLISDAGTPGVSDPGRILVNECIKNNIKIVPIPGASSVTSAISISGFSDKFFFYGFLPEKQKKINEDLNSLSNINCSVVFFVSGKKIKSHISVLKKFFFKRKILICREITKIHEEFIRGDIEDIDINSFSLKGEFTIVISEKKHEIMSSQNLSESDKNKIKKMIKKLSIKEITSIICVDGKISKKNVYDYCLKIKNEN